MITALLSNFAASCSGGGFFGFPTWYKYLEGMTSIVKGPNGNDVTICTPQVAALGDIWLIVAAVIEILVRLAALIALGFVIWGGIKYIVSRGEPNSIAQAKQIIIDGIIGLVIAIAATALINFAARSLM